MRKYNKEIDDEESEQSNSDNRWLQNQVNSMKKKMIATQLYKKQEQQQVDAEQKEQEQLQFVKVKKKSIAWKYFKHNQRYNKAKCIICRAIYQLGGKSTTIMLYHLKSSHPQTLNDTVNIENIENISRKMTKLDIKRHRQGQKLIKQNQNSDVVLNSCPLDIQTYEVVKLLQNQNNYNPIQIRNIIKNKFWKNQTQIQTMFEKLNRNRHITVLMTNSKQFNVCLISDSMKQNYIKFQDTLSFWYHENPLSNSLPAIIYVIVQDSNINPLIAGIFLLFNLSQNEITSTLTIYRQHINRISHLVVCGPQFLVRFCQQVFYQKGGKTMKTKIIHLNTSLEALATNISTINFLYSINFYLLSKKEKLFIGFLFTKDFVDLLLGLTPIVLGHKNSVVQLLSEVFQICTSISKEDKDTTDKSQNILMQLIQMYPQVKIAPQVKSLSYRIGDKIYQKIIYCYIYSQTMIQIDRVEEQTIFFRHLKSQKFHLLSPLEVTFKGEKYCCSCGLSELLGIPCPHILHILCRQESSLQNYLDPRWLTKIEYFCPIIQTMGQNNFPQTQIKYDVFLSNLFQ